MVELGVSDATGTFLDPSTFANAGDTSLLVEFSSTDELTKEVTINTQAQAGTTDGAIELQIMRGNQYEPASNYGY